MEWLHFSYKSYVPSRGGNELDKSFGFKHYFLNSLEFAQILSHLADTCQLLMILKSFKTRTKDIAKEALSKLKTQLEFRFDFLLENPLLVSNRFLVGFLRRNVRATTLNIAIAPIKKAMT